MCCGSLYRLLLDAGDEGRAEQSAVLADCAMLCLWVCCRALSDCVYFSEGRFTSGSLGMNGELISPTESSQSLHIYSPPLQWPLPSQANNGTLENCRWVLLKARSYTPHTSIRLNKQKSGKSAKDIALHRGKRFSLLAHNSCCIFQPREPRVRYASVYASAHYTEQTRAASSERGLKLSMAA